MKTKYGRNSLIGVSTGAMAYLIWGLSPLYWKSLHGVPALEIILHRIVWSFFLLLGLILVFRQFGELIGIIKKPVILLILLATSILVSMNWLTYIWAVNNGFIIQASLGYYINPLVNVLLGMVFLKERLRRLQIFAVLLAFLGVVYLTFFYGTFPWISLTLAFSFGTYALIRKTAAVSSLVGLTIETLILSFPALIYLWILNNQGVGRFAAGNLQTDLFLIGAAFVTAVPLLLFNLAGKRLMLATLGFLQYLAPTCMFLIGIFLWGETLVMEQLICFILIWMALALYTIDSVYTYRR